MSLPIQFGTDGWRGVIADDFTFSNLRRIADATARFIQNNTGGAGTLLIGYDRRFLSREFAHCAAGVFLNRGLSVKIGGTPMPTPALSVCVSKGQSPWGIMITASHNPSLYNGFKIKDSKGRSAPPEITRSIEALLRDTIPASLPRNPSPSDGFDYRPPYEAYLRSRLDWKILVKSTSRVVLEHLYGVSAGVPERLLKRSAMSLTSLHASEDPLFGGVHPEPIRNYLEPLRKEVLHLGADIGLAFDGDADRLGVIDDQGIYLTPHQVFPLLVLHSIENKRLKGKIVQSLSLGALGERIAKAYHLPFEEVPVGFKHVAEHMVKEDILAGGEESGGYALQGGIPERDGILSGLYLLEMMAMTGQTPSKLVRRMEKQYGRARFSRRDLILERPVPDKNLFAKHISDTLPGRILGQTVSDVRTYDGVKIVLANEAWVLIRPSGTEPLLRTYAESDNWSDTHKLLLQARQLVAAAMPCRTASSEGTL